MSSSVSSKFQDHYITLGVEPRADSEAIQAAYTRLAQKYHPDNRETGDPMNFEAVNMAYEVLSDPGLRAEFDKVKGVDRDGEPTFTGAHFFEALKQGALLRSTVLCILCDRRRMRPYRPTLTIRNIENMLQTTAEELMFAMWYLKQRGMVLSDDKSTLQITADGMDFLERNPPSPEGVLALIKPEAMSVPNAPVQTVLSVLHRVLTRDHQPQNVRSVAPRPK